jgi:hypothetical protein
VLVVFGGRFGHVIVVRGGLTRTQPEALRCTQYQKFDEPLEASQASETLVSVPAVIRRFVGVLGPPLAAAVPTRTVAASTRAPAASGILRTDMSPPPSLP